MATATVTDDAIDDLRFQQMFDPDAAFDYGTSTRLSLTSDDGYQLLFAGTNFAFDSHDAPTSGTIADIFLYDPSGDLVGRFDGLSYSLENYYDTVAVDGHPSSFVADLLSGADKISGGAANDYLEGYGGNDVIAGGAGADLIDGGTGDDRIDGGVGADQLYGFDGADTVLGGDGNDELYGEKGVDFLSGGAGNDQLYGGDDNDTLSGGAGADRLEGGSGNDRVVGGDDNDRVGGGDGNDLLEGGAGSDKLYGDAGNDTLIGGAGGDFLTGGSGADMFRFTGQGDAADRIFDFTRGQDHLQFVASGYAGLTADFALVVNGDPHATTTGFTFLFDTDSHKLFYDADGTGAGAEHLIATLDNVNTLSRGDFSII